MGSLSLFKQAVRIFLAVVLGAGSPSRVFAGPGDDARQAILAGREKARATARQLMLSVLQDAYLRSSFSRQTLAAMSDARIDLRKAFQGIAGNLDEMSRIDLDVETMIQNDDLYLKAVDEALNAYVRNYEAAQLESRLAVERFRTAEGRAREIRQTIDRVVGDLSEICEKGIAADLESPNLPALKVQAPHWQVVFSVTSDSEGNARDGGMTSASDQEGRSPGLYLFPLLDGTGPDGPAYNAAVSYVLPTFLYGVFGGTVASFSMMAALAAGGVTIAIAAVLYLVQDYLARDEARRVADAVERVFWEKADARTVAEEMKDTCRSFLPRLRAVPSDIEALSAPTTSPALRRLFDQRAEESSKQTAKFAELAEARSRKWAELAKQSLPAEQLTREIQTSSEGKAYDAFLSSSGFEGLMEALTVHLIRLGVGARKSQDVFRDAVQNEMSGLQNMALHLDEATDSLRDRLWALGRLRMELSLEKRRGGLVEALKAEAPLKGAALALHARWQRVYAQAVRRVLQNGDIAESRDELLRLQMDLREEMSRQPRSTLLRTLGQRTESLLKAIAGMGRGR